MAAVLTVGLAGVPGVGGAEGPPGDHNDKAKHQDHRDKDKDKPAKRDDRPPGKPDPRPAGNQAEHQRHGADQQRRQEQQQQAQRQEKAQARQQAQVRQQVQMQQRSQRRQADQQAVPRPPSGRAEAAPGRGAGRLPAARQQQLIQVQRARIQTYSARLEQQQRLADQRAAVLQQQNRNAQYRFQQEYVARLRQQQGTVSNWSSYDYDHDPYFYTAPSFRYVRSGRTYETNRYGADLLRQAVNYGYEEGVRAGEADRADGYRSDYRGSYAYEDANYGYTGMYVDQGEYNYYFRQGFRRGYQDGYNARFQYGRNTNGSFAILGNVLTVILDLRALR